MFCPSHYCVEVVFYGYECYDGMVWYGMVWYGMVWYGMVWYIMFIFHRQYNVISKKKQVKISTYTAYERRAPYNPKVVLP